MKTLRLFFVLLLIATTTTFAISTATAGQIKESGVTISWDDASLFAPVACSQFSFDVIMDETIFGVDLTIKNKFGDIVADSAGVSASGKIALKVCIESDLTDTILVADVLNQDIALSTYEKPLTFISRTAIPTATPTPSPTPTVTVTATPAPAPTVTVTAKPSPAPTVTVTATPVPAPTVTVTATPVPAPTVYVNNPADQALITSEKALKKQISVLTAKLKKICSVKPKPKNC
jgi:hypothetical protein